MQAQKQGGHQGLLLGCPVRNHWSGKSAFYQVSRGWCTTIKPQKPKQATMFTVCLGQTFAVRMLPT